MEEISGSSGEDKTNEVNKDDEVLEANINNADEDETHEVNNDGNDVNEGLEANFVDEDEIPRAGMTFNSKDEVIDYYMNYAHHMGFGVTKISSKNGDDGRQYFTLACNQARKHLSNSKNLSKTNSVAKTQCKARLNACMCLDGTIVVSSIVLEHSHELFPTKEQYFGYEKPKPGRKKKLKVDNQVRIKQVGVNVRKLRLKAGDVEAIQSYLVGMQKQSSQFYYVMDVDQGCLRNVFWADGRSRAAYEYFGEVITFDTTYLTYKYDTPLASFVGVNHHGQYVLLGCALLSNEDIKTYTWLFTKWLDCMHGRAPNAIITAENRAMKNAIEVVFPKARHRWCLLDLMKKVPKKVGRHPNYESIKTLLDNIVYDSQSKSDFMERWEKMIEYYELQDNEWLKGIFDERHCWVPVYVRDTFWAGMSTIQQSESVNSFFHGYVTSRTTLKQFIEQYDKVLRDKVEQENKADFDSFNAVIGCVSHFGFESQFQKAFTNAKFKEFQVEVSAMMYCNACFERLDDVNMNSIFSVTESKRVSDKIEDVVFKVSFNEKDFKLQCMCCLFEFRCILCRHILCVLKLMGKTESVPPYYILSQWRKDLRRRHTQIKCGFDHLAGNVESQRVSKACDAFYEVASTGIDSDDDLLKVMNWIKNLKNELTCKEKYAGIVEEDRSIQNRHNTI